MNLLVVSVCVALLAGARGRRGPHHPRGEPPVSVQHHHYRPDPDTSIMQDSQLLHDREHAAEDSPGFSEDQISAMSAEELELHYFTRHDFDGNHKLDGLELLKAICHTMEHHQEENPTEEMPEDIQTYIKLVDRTLEADDADGDGYVSYAEYKIIRARQREEENRMQQEKELKQVQQV